METDEATETVYSGPVPVDTAKKNVHVEEETVTMGGEWAFHFIRTLSEGVPDDIDKFDEMVDYSKKATNSSTDEDSANEASDNEPDFTAEARGRMRALFELVAAGLLTAAQAAENAKLTEDQFKQEMAKANV